MNYRSQLAKGGREEMDFLIRDKFLKNIPETLKYNVLYKIYNFYKQFIERNYSIQEITKGYWIKKIRGIENLYELRINDGDRVFFSLNLETSERDRNITFLLYSSHDQAVKKAKRLEKINIQKLEYEINEEEIEIEEAIQDYSKNYNNVITYEIKDENMFKKFYRERKYMYYYLNDEQYNSLQEIGPLFLAGSAGSGKSTITLRKILNIEENQEIYQVKKIGYFTSNGYLKENTQNQYEYFRKENEKITEFLTLEELYIKLLKINKKEIVKFKKFKEFILLSYPNRKKLGISLEEIYSEISGIIKGLMIDNTGGWQRNIENNKISLEDYLNLSDKYSVLDTEKRKKVYSIAENYDRWLSENGLNDSNDLARKCLSLISSHENYKYDYLVVDEIQDLTEIEIFLILNLVKESSNVLLAGDIHQMINSSYFSFQRISNYYYTNFNRRKEVQILRKNYRSSQKIVELANYLTDLRAETIGNMGTNDYKESFILETGEIILTEYNEELIIRAQEDVNTAIIVSDEDEKEELLNYLNNKHRIFTIEEIKGLEYENIICYNLTGKYIEQWEHIFSGKAKFDQRYRKFFNIFYVGITRARHQLIIMENNVNKNEILKRINNFLIPKAKEEMEKIVKTTHSCKKEWFAEGEKLYKLDKIEEAQYAFEKAGYPTLIKEREIENEIENGNYKIALKNIIEYGLENKMAFFKKLIIQSKISKGEYILALNINEEFNSSYFEKEIKEGIKNLVKNKKIIKKEYDYVLKVYKRKKEYQFIGEILLLSDRIEEAFQYYESVNYQKGLKNLREKILYSDFGKRDDFNNLLVQINELLGDKSINSYGKDRYTPIQRSILIKKNPVLFEMLLKLGAKVDTPIKGKTTLLHEIPIIQDLDFSIKIILMEKILEKGVDIHSKNIYNQEVTDIILKLKNEKMLNWITKKINGEYILDRAVENLDIWNIKKLKNHITDTDSLRENISKIEEINKYDFRKKKLINQILKNLNKQ